MARDRYLQLLRALHFSDNNVPRNNDTLKKIRVIVDHLRNTFRNAFTPHKELCIDESLLLFKGRLVFKQYIPAKRHRFGIKLFVLCDSKISYILDFVIYTGKSTDLKSSRKFGVTGDVVYTFLELYLDRGHTLYIDNWYTSPDLFMWLFDRATNACGTLRKNRKNVPSMNEKLTRGQWTFRTSSNKLLVLKYCDKKEVFMLSTTHDHGSSLTKKVDYVTKKCKTKPSCIVDYNCYMGAVDKTDMLLSSVECVRHSTKWYKKVFFHLLDMCLLNAHALDNFVKKKNRSLADFQLELISNILEEYPPLPRFAYWD